MSLPPDPVTRFRAIIFDLGGVVLGSPLPAIAAYETQTGLPPHFVARLVVEGGDDGPWARLERGELDAQAFGAAFEQQAVAAGCLNAQPLGFGAEYLGLGVVTALLAVFDGGNALGVAELLAAGNRLLRTVGHGGQDSW